MSAEICQASGQLASEGCRRSVAIDPEGNETGRPLVSWEYFRRGTEPTDECPIHGTPRGGTDVWRSIIGPATRLGADPSTPRGATSDRRATGTRVPPIAVSQKVVPAPAAVPHEPQPVMAPALPPSGPSATAMPPVEQQQRPAQVRPGPSASPVPVAGVQAKGFLKSIKRIFTRDGKGGL
jgi:hypothetical protein